MIIFCSDSDDNHAPFPHRIVIPELIRRIHDTETGEMITVREQSQETFVICAHCDHLINRPAGKCRCRERCHQQTAIARALEPLHSRL